MKHLIASCPNVAEAFFGLTKACRDNSSLGTKTNELILVGMFTATGAERGLITHMGRALEAGASAEEIHAAIALALPVVGITKVNLALGIANEVLHGNLTASHA